MKITTAILLQLVSPWLILAGCMALAGCGESPQESESAADSEIDSAGARIAAQVPDSEIFLASLEWQDGRPTVSNARNITQRQGYDNQPQFSSDGKSLFFTAIHDDEQADIYRYLIDDGQTIPYANTPQSEYSPTVMPGSGGLSVVRVEDDGTQRLWRFPAANAEAELVLESVRDIGYHAWLSPGKLAVFLVGDPVRLELVDVHSERRAGIATQVGRALARIPAEDALAFVDQQASDLWRVVRYDLDTGAFAELITTPPGSQDFAWAANGGLFMGDGARLLFWDGHADSQWQTVRDFSASYQGTITRIAVAPAMDRIAFVVDLEVAE